jgi:hypothetical protein
MSYFARGLEYQGSTTGNIVRRHRVYLTLAAVFLSSLAGGCGTVGAIYEANAFGPSKTYAVVSIMSLDKVSCTGLGGNPCNGGLFGLVNALARKDAYSEEASDVLERTYPRAIQLLRASSLKIAPDVKNLRAYRAALEDAQPTPAMQSRYLMAKGYKYFSEESLSKLARQLQIEGVITMTFSYSAARSGLQVAGIGGSYKAVTNVHAFAVDKNGKRVWADSAVGQSDDSVGTASGAVDFPKLRPFFVDSTNKAVRKLIENFESKVQRM